MTAQKPTDAAAQLREPFRPDQIGKLPRVTCKACSDSRARHCENHQRKKCNDCNNYISTQHIHLDYAGHAAVTDRLLTVDPSWTWEPVAFGADGLPQMDRHGGLWIKLTVAGVTRMGYGDADGKQGPDGVKGAISDALRNGAMRFGVGLDLWHKDGPLQQDAGDDPAGPPAARNGSQNGSDAEPAPSGADRARAVLRAACETNDWDLRAVSVEFAERYDGANLGTEANANRITAFTKLLSDVPPEKLRALAAATNGGS